MSKKTQLEQLLHNLKHAFIKLRMLFIKMPSQIGLKGSLSRKFTEILRLRLQTLSIFFAGLVFWIWIYTHIEEKFQSQMFFYPTQWDQLQNAVQIAKTRPTEISVVSPLSDEELNRIKAFSRTKGISYSIFQLVASNPPQIELQIKNVSFGSWVELLNEYMAQWRLYPIKVEIISEKSAGMVTVSATLRQALGVSQ